MRKLLYMLVLLQVYACSSHYKFWDISHFNLQPGALKDGDPIRLLYTSQGPDLDGTPEHYIQVVAIAQNTGDTINILTPVNHGFKPADGDITFNYISPDNASFNLIQMNEQELSRLTHVDSIPDKPVARYDKVARDPEHDDIADNKFPTVIGAIGTVSKAESL